MTICDVTIETTPGSLHPTGCVRLSACMIPGYDCLTTVESLRLSESFVVRKSPMAHCKPSRSTSRTEPPSRGNMTEIIEILSFCRYLFTSSKSWRYRRKKQQKNNQIQHKLSCHEYRRNRRCFTAYQRNHLMTHDCK